MLIHLPATELLLPCFSPLPCPARTQVENVTALFVKFSLRAGRDDFAAVFRVEVDGKIL
jgi:hypothetical protein